jgi:hypothetical protein
MGVDIALEEAAGRGEGGVGLHDVLRVGARRMSPHLIDFFYGKPVAAHVYLRQSMTPW